MRLGDVADVSIVPTPNKIKRENNSRRIDIHANVKGRDLGSVASDVEQRLEKIQFPIGYYPQLLGEYKERAGGAAKSADRLALRRRSRSSSSCTRRCGTGGSPTLVFLALPAALVGAVLAAFAGDRVISLGSLVGIITVLGIAARNGILLIEHYRHLEQVEGEPFGIRLVLRGASERLSPILMTTLCTAIGAAAAGRPRQHPRPRDRAPDGRGHPGRPHHLDPADPVRHAGPVPPVRRRRRAHRSRGFLPGGGALAAR